MQITEADQAMDYAAGNIRVGNMKSKLLLQGKQGALNNYRVALTTVEDSWDAPRHRHNFDQIRFPINDAWIYGKEEKLPAGWVGYFPEGVYYGPQHRTPGLKMLVCQFGGASGCGFVGRDERKRGFDELSAKGTFEKGTFTYIDAGGKRHRKDAYEAVWEHLNGRELEYPTPRYNDVIMMNPASYSWVDDKQAKGVSRKWLGTFTERRLQVGFLRMERGATLKGGTHNTPELFFLHKGVITHGGKTYRSYAAAAFDPGEGPVTVEAEETSELLCLRMHKF